MTRTSERAKLRVRQGAQGLMRLNGVLAKLHLRVVPALEAEADPTMDFPPEWHKTISATANYTMVPPQRMAGLLQAVEHIVEKRVPGAVVECGVWKGGSSMAAALTLKRLDDFRDLYLFDTYEGMSRPSAIDLTDEAVDRDADHHEGAIRVGIEEVEEAMRLTEYPMDRVTFVKGKVEDTVPEQAPEQIALLRLDTDWYESTRHELEHLFPRLVPGGILIIDDYGFLTGARQAVDEFFAGQGVFLHRLDFSGRLLVRD